MQKRKSNHITAVETAIAKSADTDTDQTDTPRPLELEDRNAIGQSDAKKAEPRSAAPPIVPDGEPAICYQKAGCIQPRQVQVQACRCLGRRRDAADGTSASQHLPGQGLRSPARGRNQILVIRGMLCQRAD